MRSAIIAAIVATLVSATTATAAFVVTSANIKNGTIRMVDISAAAKRSMKGQRGPRGFQGVQGPQGLPGAPGPAGAQGPAGIERLTTVLNTASIGGGGIGQAIARCPSGQIPVSGGFLADLGVIVGTSFKGGDAWFAGGENLNGTTAQITAVAYCSPNVRE